MTGRIVDYLVFTAATLGTFLGWGAAFLYGESARDLSVVLISTSYLMGVWAVWDVHPRELVAISKAVASVFVGYVFLSAFALLAFGDAVATPPGRTGILILGQAFLTLVFMVLPVLLGRELWRRVRGGGGRSTDDGSTPEERVLSDAEYREFDPP